MKVKFTINMGRESHQEIVEYEDDVTEDELQEYWTDWTANYIDGGWRKLDENGK